MIGAGAGSSSNQGSISFGDILGKAINQVNQSQTQADTAMQKYIQGDDIDLHAVTIAMEKAGLDLRMAMQIRNKVIQAYEELKRMQF